MDKKLLESIGKPVDYVIVRCGYTGRLDKKQKSIKKFLNNNLTGAELLYSYDYLCGSGEYVYADNEKVTEFLKLCDKNGITKPHLHYTINFKCGNVGDAVAICEYLMEFDHCAFFDMENLYDVKYYTVENKTILYLKFDTESG
jgi:hypothetical protein